MRDQWNAATVCPYSVAFRKGCVATHLRCCGIFSNGIIGNFLLLHTVKQFRKSVNINILIKLKHTKIFANFWGHPVCNTFLWICSWAFQPWLWALVLAVILVDIPSERHCYRRRFHVETYRGFGTRRLQWWCCVDGGGRYTELMHTSSPLPPHVLDHTEVVVSTCTVSISHTFFLILPIMYAGRFFVHAVNFWSSFLYTARFPDFIWVTFSTCICAKFC